MQADPGTFFVSDSGAGRPAIVFVHGFGADHRVWDAAAASLLPAMRVLACDLPGHGLSLGAEGEGSAKSA
ncbi:MAG: alpha/beta fold hydrolase, partial [Mesorhizobium sp.]